MRTMRKTVVILALVGGCATVPAPVAEYSVCERTCRAAGEHCIDGSAKERETRTTCEQDLRNCLNLCDAQAQSDPSGREEISKRRGEGIVPGTYEPAGRIVPKGR